MSSLLTSGQNTTVQPVPVRLETSKSTVALPADPLPTDLQGQRLCEIFGRYLYCSIYADAPTDVTEKPRWHTQRRYKLKNRVLYRDWQDAEKLIGVRPGHTIAYALLDIDINSPYHPRQDAGAIARIEAALETIGITRTLRIRSSWSEGLHLYMPLPELVKTFDLAVALKNCLEPQGFKLKQGHLECFPNVKAYGNIIKTEYLAHRLPLQPGSGSCLLDEAFSPSSSRLGDFLSLWDVAAAGQDISTLRQALLLARKNRHKKVRSRLNKVDSWKKDLETVLAEGWTGTGQTNQLLKEFGCYGHVFLGYCDEELVDFIHQQAISSPGYQQWCRHQREITMRSRVWATAIEQYYWPMGTYGEAQQKRKETTSKVPFNDFRARNAQESIKAAVQHLKETNALPEKATARVQAVRKAQARIAQSSSSLETLYKAENKKLWHPDFCSECSEGASGKPPVIGEATGLSESKDLEIWKPRQELKPCERKELRTKGKVMKCKSIANDVLVSSKTKFSSGKGGAGGVKSFPQAELKANALHKRNRSTKLHRRTVSNASFIENGISRTLSETIAAIQDIIRKLSWPIEQINGFIARRFQDRRRAQLSDEELLQLLYYLRVQYLEDEQINTSEVQNIQVLSSASIS